MAIPSTPPPDQEVSIADEAPAGTRNIPWCLDGQQSTKYLHVPNAYELDDIIHVDWVGMFHTFKNGDTWLTLDNKRLFLMSGRVGSDHWVGLDDPEDWPIMSPEELKEALANHPSSEELEAECLEIQAKGLAMNPLERLAIQAKRRALYPPEELAT